MTYFWRDAPGWGQRLLVDNVTADPGSGGATFKTDEDTGASAHVPVTKIELGVDNSFDGYVSKTNPMPSAGNVAHDAVDADNPVKVGGRALTTLPTAVATGDRVDAIYTTQGAATVAGVDGTTPRAVAVNASGQLEVDISAQQSGDITIADGGNVISVDDGGANLSVDWAGTVPPIGAGTEAAALRVTLATDSTGVVSVDDGGGALTVDNAGTFAVQSTLQANSGVDIGDVDVTSVVPGVAATNLGKAEDAAHTTGDTGVMALAVRNDALAALAGTDGDYAPLQVDADGALYVHDANLVSTSNSTTATLANDATYTGTGEDVSQYAAVTVTMDASHDSAASGLSVEFSTDSTNWDDTYTWTYTAADGARRFQFPITAQYFRVVYTNGGTTQSHFRLQTILHSQPVTTSVHRLGDNVDPDRSATVVKSALLAQISGTGDFTPVASNAQGALDVSITGGATGEAADVLAAGADNVTNTTNQLVTAAMGYAFDGSTWDRLPGNSTDGLTVNLGTNNDVNVSQVAGTATSVNAGNVDAGTQRVVLASDQAAVTVDLGANNDVTATGNVAHDAADSGNPIKLGAKALPFGTAPTEVASNDRTDLYATLAGQLLTMAGHPNTTTVRANYTAAQTNTAIASTSEKIVVTRCSVTLDNATTVDVQCRIGFGTATTPTTTGVILSHPGIAAGSGVVEGSGAGILGVGAAGEDVRITCEVPTTGSLDVVLTYYEISA